MDADFLKGFGMTFGLVAALPVVVLAFRFGGSVGKIKDGLELATESLARIEPVLVTHALELQKINHTLHGPKGDSGMYETLRGLERRFHDVPNSPKRRRTDRKTE